MLLEEEKKLEIHPFMPTYAKTAKKISKMKKDIYTQDDVDCLAYPDFYEDWIRKGVRLAPMQCEELK